MSPALQVVLSMVLAVNTSIRDGKMPNLDTTGKNLDWCINTDGCALKTWLRAGKSDRNGNLLPVYGDRFSLGAVLFLSLMVIITLLESGSGRSQELDLTYLQSGKTDSASRITGNREITIAGSDTAGAVDSKPTIQDSFMPVNLDQNNWREYTVKSENTLLDLATRIGLDTVDAQSILALGEEVDLLDNLYAGDKIKINRSGGNRILAVEYDIHAAKRLRIIRAKNSGTDRVFRSETMSRPFTKRVIRLAIEIKESLYRDARAAGLTTQQIQQLIRIFDSNIDYSRDLKRGDTFTIVYEQHYRSGDKVADSPILAAKYHGNNKEYSAIRYSAPNDIGRYYTPDGIGLRKPFLQNPVDYPVISSGYNPTRKHPILHKIRAHKGVDYAAKHGTPIKATGDGIIKYRGRYGSYGKTVIIQHNHVQDTLYAHMHKYVKNFRVGDRVRQGDIIGYVGKSGLATGTHLHYEFHVDGKHVDPLKISYPLVSVPENHLYDFFLKSQLLLSQLRGIEKVEVAWADANNDTSG